MAEKLDMFYARELGYVDSEIDAFLERAFYSTFTREMLKGRLP